MSLLQVRDVSKSFVKGSPVLREVSLDVEPQTVVALLGASGSGKTTLMNIIAGLDDDYQGSVLMNGEDISRVPPERRNIPLVFQDYALFPHLTVAQNINFGIKSPPPDLDEFLKRAQLEEKRDAYPMDLSGGQQQRVALLRALRRDPELILLDEPLSNIDPVLRGYVRGQLRQLLTESKTAAILVTHDIQDAAHLADRVALLNKGKIEQVGRLEEMYLHPETEWVADFFDHMNRLEVLSADAKMIQTPFGAYPLNQLPSRYQSARSELWARPHQLYLSEDGLLSGQVSEVYFECPTWIIKLVSGSARVTIRTLSQPKLKVDDEARFALRYEA